MRAALLILTVLAIPFTGCDMIKGSGNSKTVTHSVDDFDSVSFGGSGDIEITVGQPKSVEVTIDDNLQDNVTIEVKDGKLKIGSRGSWSTNLGLKVKISVPELNSYNSGGSGDAVIHFLQAEKFEATVTGSGSLQANGSSTEVSVTVTGSGSINLAKVSATKASAVSTGSGSISVFATDSVTASTTGSGSINIHGNPPTVVEAITGSGAINRK